MDIGLQAFGWGIVSAISLPLGAVFGVFFQPRKKINSAFMAFGAGALLFALTIELFGEAIHESEKLGSSVMFAVMVGAIIGGVLFDSLNKTFNAKGAFARSLSTARRYLSLLKKIRAIRMVRKLSQVPVLASLPPAKIADLIPSIKHEVYQEGEQIFTQGDKSDALYFIIYGEVKIISDKNGKSKEIEILTENDVFGVISLITDTPRTATAICQKDTHVYKLPHRAFIKFRKSHPDVDNKISEIAKKRADELNQKIASDESDEWSKAVKKHLAKIRLPVSDEHIQSETQKVIQTGLGAAFAIWLGILIDAIPESLVIGMLTNSISGVSFAFIVGVFLANLPEAMSSSTTMLRGGMKIRKIILMWFSLVLLTGIGAYLGAILFQPNPEGATVYLVGGIRGLAAGAMLTMIAETMLPEAFEQGGTIVGLSTLFGFLAALSVKILG